MRIVHVLTVPFSFRLLKVRPLTCTRAVRRPRHLVPRASRRRIRRVGARHRAPRADDPGHHTARRRSRWSVWFGCSRAPAEVVQGEPRRLACSACSPAWLIGVPVRIYHVRGLPFTTAAGLRTGSFGSPSASPALRDSRPLRQPIDARCDHRRRYLRSAGRRPARGQQQRGRRSAVRFGK